MRLQTLSLLTLAAFATQSISTTALASSGDRRDAPIIANSAQVNRFNDLENHWAQSFILALVEREIMSGFPDGRFQPNAAVTRAEFAAVLQRAFANGASNYSIEFADVPPNHWGREAIQFAYESGFLGKYDRDFRPDQKISRIQVLVSLVNGLNLPVRSSDRTILNNAFQDASQIPDYARESAIAALDNELITTNPNIPNLSPNQIASRADIAALVYRALVITGRLDNRPVADRTLPRLTETAASPPPAPPQTAPPPPPASTPSNFAPVQNVFETYTLGSGDRIRLDVLTAPEYNGETLVLADGTVNLPLIGKVQIEGMTIDEATDAIAAKYGYYIRQPVMTVTLAKPRPLRVAIAGEVSRPGSYSISLEDSPQYPTVTQAIEMAGGITQTANLRQVQIRRSEDRGRSQIVTVNLWDLLQGGNLSQDLALRDGDSIFIPTAEYADPGEASQLATASFAADTPQSLKIAVVGEVTRPGTHIVQGEGSNSDGTTAFPTITQALKTAGGITQSADLGNVQIRRPTKSGGEQVIAVNLWLLLRAGNLRQDVILQQGDTIVVPTARYTSPEDAALIADASFAADPAKPINIAIVGEVARPGTHTIVGKNPGSGGGSNLPTITQAIEEAGGITLSANVRAIEVLRRTREGSQQRIPVDLWQLLQAGDVSQDVALQPGDTIVIPKATALTAAEATELASASFSPDRINVNVVGEVAQPGLVEIPPNTPLNQALLAAGGFSNRASTGEVELIRLNANGTVSRRNVEVDLNASPNDDTNPILRNNDAIVVDRSGLAKVTDTVGEVARPIGSFFSIFNFLRILQ
ncbi:S-layer homology domain-containing protein [Oxynema sp. CENA135]|uniref:SLBB domain-containing protein n=1 Tax=Oxynema sp. CENA135 TaxID=984206 RepID=UPI00190AB031|nr:SLBB domain-containing protein [Oxynema sp. CENA135]MBK4732700.1 S-layer homology domain-containing protein [Oxynema sp. CENA135]